MLTQLIIINNVVVGAVAVVCPKIQQKVRAKSSWRDTDKKTNFFVSHLFISSFSCFQLDGLIFNFIHDKYALFLLFLFTERVVAWPSRVTCVALDYSFYAKQDCDVSCFFLPPENDLLNMWETTKSRRTLSNYNIWSEWNDYFAETKLCNVTLEQFNFMFQT